MFPPTWSSSGVKNCCSMKTAVLQATILTTDEDHTVKTFTVM
jgi:hypothetical protein